MTFRDRKEAAEQLAQALFRYRDKNPLVLGIPRGGVPMARVVADELGGQLDIVLVHKLCAPLQREFAVGAVDEDGHVWVAPYARESGADETYLREETERELELIRRRRQSYTPVRGAVSCRERITIVVDDGVATGSTVIAALRGLRKSDPARLVAAIGVAPTDTLDKLEAECDEVVCCYDTHDFGAVGRFFTDFSPVTDAEVIEALNSPTSAARSGVR